MVNQPVQVDIQKVFKDLKIDPAKSVHRAIQDVGLLLDNSSNRLNAANKLIVRLGASPVSNERQAEVLAKGLIEQAFLNGQLYNAADAIEVVNEKYTKLLGTMPYLYALNQSQYDTANPESAEPRASGGRAKKGDANDKKAAALDIFLKNKDKKAGEVAQLIADELDITYANAYYYVSRVFAKMYK